MSPIPYCILNPKIYLLVILSYVLLFPIIGTGQQNRIVAPDDLVVSCGFQFTTKDLSDTSNTLFGKLQLDSSQRKKLISLDVVCKQFCETNKKTGYPGPIPPAPSKPPASAKACAYFGALYDSLHKNNLYEMVWGFDGYLANPLDLNYTLEVLDLRFCNQGKILRIFSTQGPNQTLLRDTQTIWVVNCHPFYINTLDLCDPNDDVVIPDCDLKQVLNGCMIPNRDTSSYPKLPRDSCRSIGIDFVDSIGVQLPEHYFYVLRHWQLTDWCQFDPMDPDSKGRFNITDTIFVIDDQSPKTSIALTDCSEADSTGFAQVMIQAHATDNCTSDDYISYSYLIDLNADGMGPYDGYDLSVGPLRPREIVAGKIPINQDNPFATYSTNPINASGNYPIGKHKIVYVTVDGLNNESKDTAYFEVERQEAPEVICPSDVFNIPVHLPQSIVLDIKTLLSSVVDNCTVYSKLKIYLDGQREKIHDLITCDDFLDAGNPDTLIREYKIYVEDAIGNIKICTAQVNFIRLNACDPQNKIVHIGQLMTQNLKPIEQASIMVHSDLQNLILDQKACTSNFEFSTFGANPAFYLSLQKVDAVANGVDVLDAYLIYQHYLGHLTLSNPFNYLAADLHKNKVITSADVLQVLRIILGINSNSINPENCWLFFNAKDSTSISDVKLLKDTILTCIGLKLGDLTGDALTICDEKYVEPSKCIKLNYPALQAEKGKQYRVPVTCSNYNSIIGFQSGFQFIGTDLILDSILEGKLKFPFSFKLTDLRLDSTHFNFAFVAASPVLYNLTSTDVLFELVITAKKDGLFTDYLVPNNLTCKTVAYQEDKEALSICTNSVLIDATDLKSYDFSIFPNPFSDKLQIRFPQNFNKSNLQIVDVFGRQIYSTSLNANLNQDLELPGYLFPNKGIFYIKLQSDDERLVKVIVRE
ncbi:MAG: T9SS type A sorting domain-containing protein [Saprospiraceae bacterium]